MNAASFGLIITGVLLNTAAQLFLKAGTSRFATLGFSKSEPFLFIFKVTTQPHILLGLVCCVMSVAIWIAALSRVPVSVAYPMLSIGYLVNAIAAWYLFSEALSVTKVVGICIILLGVLILAKS